MRPSTHFFYSIHVWIILCAPSLAVAQATGLDIIEYDLSVRLNLEQHGLFAPLNTLSATARITFVNTNDSPVVRVPVILYRLLKVETVHSSEARGLEFTQQVAGLENWELYQANIVSIDLDRPLPSGATSTLEIIYSGPMVGIEESQMLYVRDSLDPEFTIIRSESASYPHLAEPTKESFRHRLAGNDVFDHVVTVTVPETHVVASGLELIERETRDEWTTWVYRSRQPSFQIVVPVAPYDTIETADARVYYFPEDREGAERVSQGITDTMELYERWFGALHDRSFLAVVEIPEWYGSQALRPTVIQDARAFRDPSAMLELYHEISHFWNVPDPEPAASRWNEGLAMYLQQITRVALDEDTGELSVVWERAFKGLKEQFEEHPDYRGVPLAKAGAMELTSVLSYRGGQLMFALLDHRLGQAQLLDMLKNFYRKYVESGATSKEFADFVVTHTPGAKPIIDEWFLGSEYSDLVLAAADYAALAERYQTN
jgi:hypothetical protein